VIGRGAGRGGLSSHSGNLVNSQRSCSRGFAIRSLTTGAQVQRSRARLCAAVQAPSRSGQSSSGIASSAAAASRRKDAIWSSRSGSASPSARANPRGVGARKPAGFRKA